MTGDITLEARWQWQSAAKVISPFIIFAVFDVSFRRYNLYINYSFFKFMSINGNNIDTVTTFKLYSVYLLAQT